MSVYLKLFHFKDELNLLAEERRIILKGSLKRKVLNRTSEAADIHIYILDHCLLIMKSKYFDHTEKYRLYKKVSLPTWSCFDRELFFGLL